MLHKIWQRSEYASEAQCMLWNKYVDDVDVYFNIVFKS